MTAGFVQTALDLSQINWGDIEKDNATLERLQSRRKSEIVVSGPLVKSKPAWKFALLQQSILYRVLALANGCADMWNTKNVVCSILAARGLLETIAVSEYIRSVLKQYVQARDIDAINDMANKLLFATRDPNIISKKFGYEATNVLTYIDRLSEKLPGIREHYDFISEWCHPNGSGHFFTFAELNKKNGTVTFSERTPRIVGIQGHVIAIYGMIAFVELAMNDFDEIIPTIAEFDDVGPWLPTDQI